MILLLLLASDLASADELSRTISAIKPSIVGIGSFQKLRAPPVSFVGTGFAVGDGLTIITAAHVIHDLMENDGNLTIGVLIPHGELSQFRPATIAALDQEHDLARLQIGGAPLPAMQLGDSAQVAEGAALAFTGFPLGMVLGLHPVTHHALVSSITPLTIPSFNTSKLDARLVSQLNKPPYMVFQLDGTAYPGNSGSPLYQVDTGAVVGVINMVYVKGLKEAAISTPSGITYAIPANYIRNLLPKK